MPQNFDFPLAEKAKINIQKHSDLNTVKQKMLEARLAYIAHYKENPESLLKNSVFGEMNRYEWYLLERKHLNHHFEQFGIL
jgi:oxepin-CoA hydrolase/3-oxo-5,6-dehydrosuberyl-CoA semialdehyde dehydrogenase